MGFPISIMTETTGKIREELMGLPERKWMDESATKWDTKTNECWFCARENDDENENDSDAMTSDIGSDDNADNY